MPLLRTFLRAVHRVSGERVFTERFFENRFVQRAAGFTSLGGRRILDHVGGVEIEYAYDTAVGRCLFFTHSFENPEIEMIARKSLSGRGPIVLDVGANIGWHTIRWARAAPEVRLHAFEPAPEVRQILERNLSRNSVNSRVTVVPAAVSNRITTATFYECEDNAFSSLKDTGRLRVRQTITVPVTTLDRYVEERSLSGISLIKVDVEGFESEVLEGGRQTLERQKPDLFVEIYGGNNSNPDPERTVRLTQAAGYKAFVFVDGELVPYRRHSDRYYNYYFTCR